SPDGRPDQNIRFHRIPGRVGPDAFIVPWGDITGRGARFVSPDILVVDDNGAPTQPHKGQSDNHLQVTLHNVGTAVATGIGTQIRFVPSCPSMGTAPWESIPVSADQQAITLQPDEERVIHSDWDLSHLDDTNHGQWGGLALGDFDHFCVRVDLTLEGDINAANNTAQTNFVDVPTQLVAPVRFLVGNPTDSTALVRVSLDTITVGYQA